MKLALTLDKPDTSKVENLISLLIQHRGDDVDSLLQLLQLTSHSLQENPVWTVAATCLQYPCSMSFIAILVQYGACNSTAFLEDLICNQEVLQALAVRGLLHNQVIATLNEIAATLPIQASQIFLLEKLVAMPQEENISPSTYYIAAIRLLEYSELMDLSLLEQVLKQLKRRLNDDLNNIELLELLEIFIMHCDSFKHFKLILSIIPDYDFALLCATRHLAPLLMIDYLLLKEANPLWRNADNECAIGLAAENQDNLVMPKLIAAARGKHIILENPVLSSFLTATTISPNSFWTSRQRRGSDPEQHAFRSEVSLQI